MDSLGVDAFFALDRDTQENRRRHAGDFLAKASRESDLDARIDALETAAGLTPDDPEIWLELARIARWTGDYLHTEAYLGNAAAAVRGFSRNRSTLADKGSGYRQSMGMETALARAWHHYDRVEWNEGLRWAKQAYNSEPGNAESMLIIALLRGCLGDRNQARELAEDLSRSDAFDRSANWIRANINYAFGEYREAYFNYFNYRPGSEHDVECWRDMGRAAERIDEWSDAKRWYLESAAAIHRDFEEVVSRLAYGRLGQEDVKLPFWIARGRYYVTGSLMAYTGYAMAQFESATEDPVREIWAAALIDAAGIILRLDPGALPVMRARGIVYAQTGLVTRAGSDLARVKRAQDRIGVQDAQVEAQLGHVHLLKEDPQSALGYLNRALELDPDLAVAWSDLGLVKIMLGREAEGEVALSRAIELDPGLAAAWYNRGLMYFHDGDLVRAEADLKEAATLAPSSQEIARLLQQVANLNRAADGDGSSD